jgi:hypothetical protein
MAEIIEVQEDQGNFDSLQPATQPEPTEQVETSDNLATEPEVPEKYKGKSLDQIVKMHQEAEKLIGRQAQEVGESRKLLDEYIKQQLNSTKTDSQPSKQQEIDWFEDPVKAVNQAVENNPIFKQLQEQQAQQLKQAALSTIEKSHPDFVSIAQSEDFTQWVKDSKIRMQLFAQANDYDVDAAMELLGTYKSIKGIQEQKSQKTDVTLQKAEVEARTKTLKAAGVQQGGSGEMSKPIYRRVDLIRLRMQDPERYNAMQDDIMQAYNEGRVK